MKTSKGVQVTPYRFDTQVKHSIMGLHGIGGSASSFAPQQAIASEQLNFLAWDMPGYQGSPLLSITTFESLARRLLDTIDELKLDKVHLLGHSIGGMVALELAVRAPERIASLSLMATTAAFGGRDETFKKQFLAARLKPLEQGKTMTELADEFIPEILGTNPHPQALANAVESMKSVPVDTYKTIITCLTSFNRRDHLSSLNIPCCLIAGGVDTNAPAATMSKMAAAIPEAEFHTIEPAGHLVNLEAPQQTNAILQSFFNRHIQ